MTKNLDLRLLVLTALLSFPDSSHANLPLPPNLISKVVSSDAAGGDRFGFSVSITTSLALAGSPFQDNSRGINAGAGYLFDAITVEQLRKLLGTDTSSDDQFGFSVSIDESKAVVSAPGDADNGSFSGSAYVFDAATGNQLFKLKPLDGASGDSFGYSVAISGNTIIVGAVADDDGDNAAGSAYLFDATTGNELMKLTASDPGELDNFGYSVTIGDTKALVGSPFEDGSGNVNNNAGSAYVFDLSTGDELFKLIPSDSSTNDKFGLSVAIDGDTAIIGSPFDVTENGTTGSAYIFDLNTGTELHKLIASDAASGDVFGKSVAISGNYALVGARADDTQGIDFGSAYIFDVATGTELFKLTALDGAEDDEFGGALAMSENGIFVSAPFDDDAGSRSGSAYLFTSPIPEPQSFAMVNVATVILGTLFPRVRRPRS